LKGGRGQTPYILCKSSSQKVSGIAKPVLVGEGEGSMRHLLSFPALLLLLNGFSSMATGQTGATTTLIASPTTITVGSSVGLAATVQPNAAPGAGKTVPRPSGTITFLDGSTSLSSAPIALAPNGIASATFPQTFGTPDPSLTSELVGDLNGDGVQDLLIYGYATPFPLQTFTSNGKGGYNASAVQTFSFSPGCSPQLIDFNGDGKPDLLCGALVAYGNGDGTFAQAVPVSFLSSGFDTAYVYTADLNGDGKTDILAVPTAGNPGAGLSPFAYTVFLNQGGGSFTSAGTFPIAPVTGGESVDLLAPVIVDLNGDGKPDLITQIQTFGSLQIEGPQNVDVLLNQGDGTFGPYIPVTIANGPNIGPGAEFPFGMATGDVNGDGKPDLILTVADDESDLDAIVLLGNGDGTFQPAIYFILHQLENAQGIPLYQTPSVVIEDLNLDGKQDLVFSNGQVGLGNGDGTFVLSSPLFPLQTNESSYLSFPLVQVTLPSSLEPSLTYLLPTTTPPAASVFTPQTSSSASISPSTLAVGTHSITARYSGDANYTADTSAAVSVTVNQAASETAVTSSANPSFAGQSVTLPANVTSPGPTPTGNVTFTSGSTTLGTVALGGGSAAYTTSSFTTVGNQTITVSYSGDANTQASSASLSLVVNAAFTLAPDGGGNTTLTVNAGQTVTAPINVTGAPGFSGQVTFACSGLPANTSCSFSPATINLSGTPAVPTLLSVNTAAGATVSQLRLGFGAYSLAFAGLILFWPVRHKGTRIWVVLFCAVGFATLGLNGCSKGSGSAPPAQTATGTYSFNVVASSGSVKTQSAYTLIVQ
jgi:Bacterial Ig-like domain (group 3)/FG-GAP-like repeat